MITFSALDLLRKLASYGGPLSILPVQRASYSFGMWCIWKIAIDIGGCFRFLLFLWLQIFALFMAKES